MTTNIENQRMYLSDEEVNFYRAQGAANLFIEFLRVSNDEEQIHHMWRSLICDFYNLGFDEDLVFPFFKNANQRGYNIQMLSTKLINILLKYRIDIDDDEAEMLALNFGSIEFEENSGDMELLTFCSWKNEDNNC